MKTAQQNKAFVERQANRDRLLQAALPHVTFDGWTERAFVAGIKDADMEKTDFRRFFPRGVRDALDHFSDWADRQMAAALADHAIDELPIRQRVALAVRLRLMAEPGPERPRYAVFQDFLESAQR